MRLDLISALLWLLFFLSWYAGMLWTSRAILKVPGRQRAAYVLGFSVGFLLLFMRLPRPHARHPELLLWQTGPGAGTALLALQIAAFLVAWWARIHLGKLWSSSIMLREGHKIITSGPYRLVRHPIYTGFIGASWTHALIAGRPTSLLGAAVLTTVMLVKALAEERFLRHELGDGGYAAYAASTPMLLPFVRFRRR